MRATAWIASLMVPLVMTGCAGSGDVAHNESSPAEMGARYEITVGTTGFEPAEVNAIVGHPVTLVLTRTTDETCGTEVILSSLGLKKDLPLDQPVEITLIPTEKGVIEYSCAMDMLQGRIIVN